MKDETESRQTSQGTNEYRRKFLQAGAALGGLALFGGSKGVTAAEQKTIELPMVNGKRILATYPQKRELILMTARPVQLEKPFHIFNDGVFTPNDAFFVLVRAISNGKRGTWKMKQPAGWLLGLSHGECGDAQDASRPALPVGRQRQRDSQQRVS